MQPGELVAVSVFVLYFVIIISLFVLILWSIFGEENKKNEIKLRYGMMAVVAFIHTWYWMFRYMSWSLHNFEASSSSLANVGTGNRIARWLVNTSLFEEAWWAVCARAVNWWWSEQLCLFTAGFFVVFLHQQNIRYKWAYMLLGQMVAISVAWSLALLASSSRQRIRRTGLSLTTTAPVTVSFVAVLLAPYVGEDMFLVNLTTMHGLLLVPFLLQDAGTRIKVSSFCMFLAVLGMAMRVRTVIALLTEVQWQSLLKTEWDVLHSHPAQASIGWDIVYTSLIWLAWQTIKGDGPSPVRLVVELVLGSVGVAAPIEFGLGEWEKKVS